MDERLQKQLDFILEIDKEKNIFRQTHLSGHGRNENDAEHAWHMAIMAYLLQEYSNEKIDVARVMLMCLIHDVVEIDAGDTYAYDAEGLKTQKAREEAAKERLYSMLPEDQKADLTAIFDEFEERKTSEAKFARALDNLQPRKQGSRSLDLLFEYLTSGAPPVQEKNFVKHSIKIRENS